MKAKEAYISFWSGTFYVRTYPGQKEICHSVSWQRATRRARNLGYNVRCYGSTCGSDPSPEEIARRKRLGVKGYWQKARGSYVLPAKKKAAK